jgi:uncharacterized protein YbcI
MRRIASRVLVSSSALFASDSRGRREAVGMSETHNPETSALLAVSNAMVKLHKEQFGRGPTTARANFAGPDMLVCMLRDAFLPAERKLVELGDAARVRDTRTAYQAATANDFITAVEQIVDRKVQAFASGIDAETHTVFEVFSFEPRTDRASEQ